MFLRMFGEMRKRREAERQEAERILAAKKKAHQERAEAAFAEIQKLRSEKRLKQYQAANVTSLDTQRERMQGTLTAQRAYRNDMAARQADADMTAAREFIQSLQDVPKAAD